jgi:hypothetical protein
MRYRSKIAERSAFSVVRELLSHVQYMYIHLYVGIAYVYFVRQLFDSLMLV